MPKHISPNHPSLTFTAGTKVDTGSILTDDFPRYYPILIISDVGFTVIAGFFNDLTVKTGNPVTRQGITL